MKKALLPPVPDGRKRACAWRLLAFIMRWAMVANVSTLFYHTLLTSPISFVGPAGSCFGARTTGVVSYY